MNDQLDCIFCIQRQALEAVRLATIDVKKQEKIQRVVMAKLLEINWNSSPPDIADVVYNIIRKESKEDDPFKIVKKECNDYVMGIYPELKRIVDQSATPLLTVVRLAIAGNVINYETLPDSEKIFFMLIAKCPLIAKEFGVQQGDIILKRGSG